MKHTHGPVVVCVESGGWRGEPIGHVIRRENTRDFCKKTSEKQLLNKNEH